MGAVIEKNNVVSTDTVKAAIESYINDRGSNRFTTADIARFMGVDEYQVRAAFTWLTRYRVIEIIPGVRSKRYLGDPKDPSKRRHTNSYYASMYQLREVCSPADFKQLMGVFCRG